MLARKKCFMGILFAFRIDSFIILIARRDSLKSSKGYTGSFRLTNKCRLISPGKATLAKVYHHRIIPMSNVSPVNKNSSEKLFFPLG